MKRRLMFVGIFGLVMTVFVLTATSLSLAFPAQAAQLSVNTSSMDATVQVSMPITYTPVVSIGLPIIMKGWPPPPPCTGKIESTTLLYFAKIEGDDVWILSISLDHPCQGEQLWVDAFGPPVYVENPQPTDNFEFICSPWLDECIHTGFWTLDVQQTGGSIMVVSGVPEGQFIVVRYNREEKIIPLIVPNCLPPFC